MLVVRALVADSRAGRRRADAGGVRGSPSRAGAPPSVVWLVYRHLPGVVDLAGPRGDGSFLVAAAGRLFVLSRDGALSPFARGAGGYLTAMGTEPYLVLASDDAVRGTGDLLIATEGGAKTIDIRCTVTCTVRYVAAGPAIAHAEGHIVFAPS
jgi:hypothetical protein